MKVKKKNSSKKNTVSAKVKSSRPSAKQLKQNGKMMDKMHRDWKNS